MNKNEQKFFLELGNLLKEAREQKGISQQTLADKIGITRNCIGNWETGRRSIDIIQLYKICDCLGLEVDELIKKVNKYVR